MSETAKIHSLKESRWGPEIVKLDVDDGSIEGIQGSFVLTPTNPNFLGCRVHNDVVVVSSCMETGYISVHGLRSNLTMLG